MKKRNIFGLIMAAVLSLGFAACGDKNEIEGGESILLTGGDSIYLEAYIGHDPTAAYPMTVKIKFEDNKLTVSGGVNYLTQDILAQFPNLPAANTYGTSVRIDKYPDAENLKGMMYETAVALGFGDTEADFEANAGYVVKAVATGNLNGYNNPEIRDPEDLYIRIFVAYNKKTDEYRAYYQYPFLPEEE